MKKYFAVPVSMMLLQAVFAAPSLVDSSIEAVGPNVQISYELDSVPAVVTVDIQTNSPSGWVSIDGSNFFNIKGDVNRLVTQKNGTILWRSRKLWPDRVVGNSGFRVAVHAWPVDDPPPYMVVDLNPTSSCRVKYYAKESDLAGGGVLGDDMYRTTHLVLKKIKAKGVRWTMGAILESGDTQADEKPHTVMLDRDYYVSVFEVTQKQCQLGAGISRSSQFFVVESDMRPVEGGLSFNNLRGDTSTDAGTLAVPSANSVIGKFRSLTGVDFDLLSEAQWEYACRSGVGEGYWPEGSPQLITGWNDNSLECYNSPSLDYIGRYRKNGGVTDKQHYGENTHRFAKEDMVGPTNGTAIVGSFVPNRWGLYDMCGNVAEWCLDWYRQDITGLNGAVVSVRDESKTNRVLRGGCYYNHARKCRPAARSSTNPTYDISWGVGVGLRLGAPCIVK